MDKEKNATYFHLEMPKHDYSKRHRKSDFRTYRWNLNPTETTLLGA